MCEVYESSQNEWMRLSKNKAAVGLIGSSVKGDVVYIELPAVGLTVQKDEVCAMVETAKAVMELHTPVSGLISSVNDNVYDAPDSVAEEGTWLFTVDFEGEADTTGWIKRA